jgi:hypothetical protein
MKEIKEYNKDVTAFKNGPNKLTFEFNFEFSKDPEYIGWLGVGYNYIVKSFKYEEINNYKTIFESLNQETNLRLNQIDHQRSICNKEINACLFYDDEMPK